MPWMFCQLNCGSLNIDIEKSSEEGKALVCFAPGRQLQLQCLRVSSAAASHSKQQNHSTVHQSEPCVYNIHMGKSIPLKPGCALPCLPARERPAHPYSPLSWPSARPPPCPPPVLHNSARCNVFEELWIGLQCSVGFRLHCLVGLLGSDVSKEVSLNKSLSTSLSVGSSNRFNWKN